MLRPVGTEFETVSTPESRQCGSTDMGTYRFKWRIKGHVKAMVDGKEATVEQLECVAVTEEGKGMRCDTCGNDRGRPRVDNGLKAGTHCDGCWEKMVTEARSRSW